jgi:hypothetical protein
MISGEDIAAPVLQIHRAEDPADRWSASTHPRAWNARRPDQDPVVDPAS